MQPDLLNRNTRDITLSLPSGRPWNLTGWRSGGDSGDPHLPGRGKSIYLRIDRGRSYGHVLPHEPKAMLRHGESTSWQAQTGQPESMAVIPASAATNSGHDILTIASSSTQQNNQMVYTRERRDSIRFRGDTVINDGASGALHDQFLHGVYRRLLHRLCRRERGWQPDHRAGRRDSDCHGNNRHHDGRATSHW